MNDEQQLQLNQRLLEVCTTEPVDLSLAETLLQQGALPMGKITFSYTDTPDNVYTEVIDHHHFLDQSDILYTITELFLRYGMDLSKPAVPYGDYGNDCVLPPLKFFPDDEWGLRTMQLLLDHGLDADSAQDWWMHAATDLVLCFSFDDFENDPKDNIAYQVFYSYYRMLMLIASYPHVLDNDEALQKEIWLDVNHYDLMRFRRWNDFIFDVDTSRCKDQSRPTPKDSLVTIREKATGKAVWTVGFCLTPEEVFGRKEPS